MDSAKLNDWLQVLGMFALVASLIFVGLEMQQSQKIALSAAYQARADSSMILRMAPLESETLQSAAAKIYVQGMGLDQLTPEERVVLRGRWNGQMTYLENMHYQYISGFISEEHWETNRSELRSMLGRIPEWRLGIVENCSSFRDSFCVEIRAAAEYIESSE